VSSLFLFAGLSERTLPPQRFFIIDFNDPDFFNQKGFNTLGEHNFAGNRAVSVYADHSFGKYMFRHFPDPLRKIPFGFSIHGGVFWSEFSNDIEYLDRGYYNVSPSGYGEIGFGLTNLTPFLMPLNSAVRMTWQLSKYNTHNWFLHYDVQF
jgi:hypothetical protein